MNLTINQRVAMYRKLADMTQTEAAEKLGMKCSTYSQMERKGSISAERLLSLAEIFGVTPDTLLYGESKHFSPADTVVHQSSTPFSDGPALFIPTGKEESILKVLRSLPKEEYNDVLNFINEKYHKYKSKK